MTETKHIKHREGTLAHINTKGMSVADLAVAAHNANEKLAKKATEQYKDYCANVRTANSIKTAIKSTALKNKSYYNGLAAKYLTPDEYKQYIDRMQYVDKVKDKIDYKRYNERARAEINEILKPYDINIDALAGVMTPPEWEEYKDNFNAYPNILKDDDTSKVLKEYAGLKTMHKFEPKEQHLEMTPGEGEPGYIKGAPKRVLGYEGTGLKPLLKYSWDSVKQEYIPEVTDTDDDVDPDFWGDTTNKPYNYDVEWHYKE